MEIFILVLQCLIAFIFLFSGANKSYFNAENLVKKGQTGVEGLKSWQIKFIGISEILGAIGILLPAILAIYEFLIPISAICLGLIMIPAAFIHGKRKEWKTIPINLIILLICLFIAYDYFQGS